MSVVFNGPIKAQVSGNQGNGVSIVASSANPQIFGLLPSDVEVIYSPGLANANPPINQANLWYYGGTELRNFATHDGDLYIGLGYWEDNPIPGADVPSGGSIMSLESNTDVFEIEQQFSTKYFAICALFEAQWPSPVSNNILYCSTWTKIGYNTIYYRDDSTNSWNFAKVLSVNPKGAQDGSGQQAQIRSMFLYTDPVTTHALFFCGDTPNGIYSMPYDDTQAGGLGNPTLELNTSSITPPTGGSDVRVMTFVVKGGLLYATVANALYVRNNGSSPTWTLLYTDNNYVSTKTGFRGLTLLPNNSGFFVGREGSNAGVLQLSNSTGSWILSNAFMHNTDFSNALSNQYNSPATTGYGIVSYNGMPSFTSPNGNTALFIGVETYMSPPIPQNMPLLHNPSDNGNLSSLAYYFIWNWFGTGEFHVNFLPAVTYHGMESTRTAILSPFGDGRIYIGGFDCNANNNHNSAWVVSTDTYRLLNNKVM